MMVIGLTGPTGAGKTTVCDALREMGVTVIDADRCAREVTSKDAPVLRTLAREFGESIIVNGELDRRELARRAFSERADTEKLNNILLPVIKEHISLLINEAYKQGCPAVVLDAPTLFEAGCETMCDVTVAVLLDREERISRIIKRDDLSLEDALLRESAGKPDDFYKSRVDYILYNSASPEDLRAAAQKLYQQIIK